MMLSMLKKALVLFVVSVTAVILFTVLLQGTLIRNQQLQCSNCSVLDSSELTSTFSPPGSSTHNDFKFSRIESNKREKHNITSNVPVYRSHGYVMILYYPGQQGAGLRSLIALLCFIGSFGLPMYVVEPFIQNSSLSGDPGPLKFNDYFDMNHFNTEARNKGYAEIAATWEDFLQNAPRKTVLVDFTRYGQGTKRSPEVTNDLSACDNKGALGFVLNKHDFCVVKTVKPAKHGYQILTGKEMYLHVFGEWKPQEVTLVVSEWRPHWYVLNPELQPPNKCEQACEVGLNEMFHPSEELLKWVEGYERAHVGLKHHYQVAAMLRVEHLIRAFGKTDKKHAGINICFQKLVSLVGDLKKNYSQPQTFVTVDIGKYGSKTWSDSLNTFKYNKNGKEQLFGAVKSTLETLTHMTFEEWEDSFSHATGAIEDSGYIAALQRTIAGRSDCLVLVGGGQFLKLALHDYLSNHPDPGTWCIRYVCPEKEYKQVCNEILENRRSMYRLKSSS